MNSINENNDYEYKFNPNEIDISFQQISLYFLLQRLMNGEINLFPEYQRNWNIWSKEKQSRLIESILIRIPIPSFYFASNIHEEWQVVDGVQRLTTFYNYIIRENFKLEGLEFLPQFNGSYYRDLPKELQRRIESYNISINLINPRTPEEIKFIIFNRVNTGGINLNNQELRYALNQGEATRLLAELSELEIFKDATNRSLSSKRMMDFEYINRFLAFYLYYPTYYGSLDIFMSRALFDINHSSVDFNKIKLDFSKSMHYSIKIFGEYRFKKFETINYKKNNRINKALFDSISVNLAWINVDLLDKLVENKFIILANMRNLFNDNQFVDSISSSTSNRRKVLYRFESVKKILQM